MIDTTEIVKIVSHNLKNADSFISDSGLVQNYPPDVIDAIAKQIAKQVAKQVDRQMSEQVGVVVKRMTEKMHVTGSEQLSRDLRMVRKVNDLSKQISEKVDKAMLQQMARKVNIVTNQISEKAFRKVDVKTSFVSDQIDDEVAKQNDKNVYNRIDDEVAKQNDKYDYHRISKKLTNQKGRDDDIGKFFYVSSSC